MVNTINQSNKSRLGIPSGGTQMKTRQRFEISSVIDEFSAVNNSILVNDGDPTMLGTAIPYLYNLYSDLIVNPSSVSVSEFQKMVYSQPVINAALTIFGNMVKNQLGSFTHENKTYVEFINKMLDNMDRSYNDLVTDMLTFLWAGFYVGEKKYVSDGRYIYIKDVEPRPAQSILYRVDSQGHLKEDGIIQYYFNNLWTGYGNLLAFNAVGPAGQTVPNPYASKGDFDYPWRTVWAQPIGTVIIPREKCVHLAYKGLDGLDSPYGRSILRGAYDSYIARSDLNKFTVTAAKYKASQIPVVVVDPNQTQSEEGQTAFDDIAYSLNNLGGSGDGNPYLLVQGRLNESIWIDHMNSTADLNQFIEANKYYDGMMLLACLFQSDVMGMSDKGSYALGETQADLIGRNVDTVRSIIEQTIISTMIKPMLEVNFGEKEDFGTFIKKDNVSEDVALNMDKINLLASQGIKLKSESLLELMNLHMNMVDSVNNPIIEDNPNENPAINFKRSENM